MAGFYPWTHALDVSLDVSALGVSVLGCISAGCIRAGYIGAWMYRGLDVSVLGVSADVSVDVSVPGVSADVSGLDVSQPK